MTIETIIARLEEIKAKGLMLGIADLEELIRLFDDAGTLQVTANSEYIEYKNEVDNKKAVRHEELKSETVEIEDAKGNVKEKTKHSDTMCSAIIKQEMQDEETKLAIMTATVKMIGHKKDVIEHYINLVKIIIK